MSAALELPRTDCAPLYTLRCVMWRRREGTETVPVRGRASFLVVDIGLILHGCTVARFASGRTKIEMPERPIGPGVGHFKPASTFVTPEAEQTFSDLAWAALLAAFPYAATTPVDTMVSTPQGSLQ